MNITIRLFATLRTDRFKSCDKEYPENFTCYDLIRDLDISEENVAILLINGKDGRLSDKLHENDIVSIFPPVGGG